ncbi:hypothetical protein [Mycobacterium sp. E2462]|uniref:hypothetical protein n=1 Tax=Mycobacterium sp. E2462 TaxID=1834133 RepID=UPI001E34997C|nr:hypothetical protein [Mycobacterium sp. E2462]
MQHGSFRSPATLLAGGLVDTSAQPPTHLPHPQQIAEAADDLVALVAVSDDPQLAAVVAVHDGMTAQASGRFARPARGQAQCGVDAGDEPESAPQRFHAANNRCAAGRFWIAQVVVEVVDAIDVVVVEVSHRASSTGRTKLLCQLVWATHFSWLSRARHQAAAKLTYS